MKNFKEWKNNFKSYRVFVTEDGYEGWVTKPTDKDAWKAALEWVLEQANDSYLGDCYEYVYTQDIKEELND